MDVCGGGPREPQKVSKGIRAQSETAELGRAGEMQMAPLSPLGGSDLCCSHEGVLMGRVR